jgi:hypothetical protein
MVILLIKKKSDEKPEISLLLDEGSTQLRLDSLYNQKLSLKRKDLYPKGMGDQSSLL